MKILAAIFTYPPNKPYFDKCIEYFEKSCRFADERIDLMVVDFGQNEGEGVGDLQCMYLWKPSHGFGSNFNSALSIVFSRSYDYLININDDAMISEQFIKEGIDFFEANPNAGMVAGIPQEGGWCLELEDIEIPEPVHNIIDVEPLQRLWWEGSAAIYRAEALHATGIWDTNYDIALGVCGDNDYFYRMRQAGYSLYRNGSMRFFHIKGLTQTAFGREPFDKSSDIHKQRNLEYFYQKWNIRLEG